MTQTTDAPQSEMPQATPQHEHEWLHQLIGEWVSEMTGEVPGQEAFVVTGAQTVRSIGGLWVVGESQSSADGVDFGTSIVTLGYDPAKGRFVGTWFGTMMPNLWVYEGSLDADERVLALDCEGPSFTDPSKVAPYQDVITIIDADHWTLAGRTRGEDGEWVTFCTTHYRRT